MRPHVLPLALLLVAAPARAQIVDRPSPAKYLPSQSFDFGVRASYVAHSGYDAYSTNDALAQASLGLSQTGGASGPWSLALGVRWDFGSSEARSRGADASLLVHRLTAPFEGRFHASSWLYGFARIAPGLMWQRAKIDDASTPEGHRATSWNFATDVSAGASLLFASFAESAESHAPRFWLTPEVGYGWSAGGTATLAADTDADDPRRFGALALEKVAIRGPFFRVSVTTTF